MESGRKTAGARRSPIVQSALEPLTSFTMGTAPIELRPAGVVNFSDSVWSIELRMGSPCHRHYAALITNQVRGRVAHAGDAEGG